MIDFEALGRMTLDGDEDDDRDRLLILHTKRAVIEAAGVDPAVPLLGFFRQVDGEAVQVGFMDFASVGEFVRTTRPQHLDIFVSSDENDREIEAAVRAAFGRQIH